MMDTNCQNKLNISCGFPFLDRITENWQQPQLVILAARPSCCKTAFALNVVRYITVVEKVPAGYISLEEPAGVLQHRVNESFPEVNPENTLLLMDNTPQLTLNPLNKCFIILLHTYFSLIYHIQHKRVSSLSLHSPTS